MLYASLWALALLCSRTQAAELHRMEQIGIAAFPEGVQLIAEPEWRIPLYKEAEGSGLAHALTAENFGSLAAHVDLTPSFARVGPVFRLAPIAIWDLTVGAYGAWYFGTFSSLLALDDPGIVADREWKKEAVAAGERQGGGGVQAYVSTRLKAKAGPVIAIAEATVQRNDMFSYRKDLVWYWDPTDQINAPAHGWIIRRAGYLFFEALKPQTPTDRKLWVGPMLNWVSNSAAADANIRLGPVLLWKPTAAEEMPTFMLGSQAWLKSRFHDTWPPYTFLAIRWEH